MLPTRDSLQDERDTKIVSKWMEKDIPVNGNKEKERIAILISDKTSFKTKLIKTKKDSI